MRIVVSQGSMVRHPAPVPTNASEAFGINYARAFICKFWVTGTLPDAILVLDASRSEQGHACETLSISTL